MFFLLCVSTSLLSQKEQQFHKQQKDKLKEGAKENHDSTYTVPLIIFNYTAQWPEGDLKNRFGFNSSIGGGFNYKLASNWYFGINGSFLWGRNVKENGILDALKTSEGYIIDKEGRPSTVYLEERGFNIFGNFGRLFNQVGLNKSSGILTYVGAGFMQHKIRIHYKDEITNLEDNYKKGYDRLSNGPAFNGFFGYLFMSNNRLINFYLGLDYITAFTKNRREFNYDTRSFDTKTYNDQLIGLKFGWIIPLNKRRSQEFYYY